MRLLQSTRVRTVATSMAVAGVAATALVVGAAPAQADVPTALVSVFNPNSRSLYVEGTGADGGRYARCLDMNFDGVYNRASGAVLYTLPNLKVGSEFTALAMRDAECYGTLVSFKVVTLTADTPNIIELR